jgi:DNA repair photolyase
VFGITLGTSMAIGALAIPETISRRECTSEAIASPRLFKATGARKTPQVEWVEIQVKSALNRVKGMSFDWSINPYRGCAHQCPFCFARVTHWYLDQDGVNDWSSRIFVKVNSPEVLRRELSRSEWTRDLVVLGTATDPYQPAEGTYRLSRRILEALRDFRTPVSIITRSPMVARDLDILQELSDVADASICFSVITMDPDLSRELEPHVSPPLKRLEALQKLAAAGVHTTVNLAPVIPNITDNERNLSEVIQAAKDYGASELWANALHLGNVVRDSFFKYLHEKRPHLIPEYERMYPKRYAPKEYQDHVQRVVGALKAKIGFSGRARRGDDTDVPSREESAQLQLFG